MKNRPRKLLWRLRNLGLEGDDLVSFPMAKKSSSTAATLDILSLSSKLLRNFVFSGAQRDEKLGV